MQEEAIIPELYVVGAGPGDPELITMKAFKVLQRCKVLLYDNLVNGELLNYVSEDCEKIYVGKHPYGEYTPQETIHEMIKEKALSKGMVVRLKGGDPFIFGRGYEEVLYAREHGISTYYIPGITSMQAAGFDDIPLTHRNISEGIWVLTGTKKDGGLSSDLRLAMQSNATVVIYMGMKKIEEIARTYISEGMGQTPAAIIQHATLAKQKSAVGVVSELPQIAENAKLTHPAIIIIGEVVGIQKYSTILNR
jgi:uroporphyrin-III C-methyltransferase